MRRENFGKLVKALRAERTDWDTQKPWGQQKLADMVGLGWTHHIVGNIESGKKKLSGEDLIALANAFELNTAERREFINAANGVDTKYLVSQDSTPEKVIEHCRQVMEDIQAPALLIDPYYDLLGANMAAVHFFDVQDTDYLDWRNQLYPQNIISVFLDSKIAKPGNYRGRNDLEFAVRNILNYRLRTIPYRHKSYYKNQLARFHKLEGFSYLWLAAQKPSDLEDDLYGRNIAISHLKYGRLTVKGSQMPFPTEHGTLEIIVESPADEHTRKVLPKLVEEVGTQYVHLYDWPDPRKLQD